MPAPLRSALLSLACAVWPLAAGAAAQGAAGSLSGSDGVAALAISTQEAMAAATESGLVGAADFEAIDDPYVGRLIVARPAGSAVSVIMAPAGDGRAAWIQIVMTPPWDDLAGRIELAAAIAERLFDRPAFHPPPPPSETGTPPESAMAAWLYGLLYEAWLGWPGSERRLVRVRDGVAVAVEGVPPELWSIAFVADDSLPDATWPGPTPAQDPPAVAQARGLIRAGEYREARDLLLPLAEAGNPQAARLMGDMHRFGRLGPPDANSAADWYLVAGRHRHPFAVWSLAALDTEGWGVFFISNFRAPLLVQAAEAGSADALFVLSGTRPGVNYVRPEGVTAADQALQAARWGLIAAQREMARRHAEGDGVEEDAVEALAWALAAREATGPGLDFIAVRRLASELAADLPAAALDRAAARAARLVTGPPPWPDADREVPGQGPSAP